MKREWLIKIRNKKNLSQEKMAILLNIPLSTYSAYEIGTRRPKIEEAQRIAKILRFKWTKFYDRENDICE